MSSNLATNTGLIPTITMPDVGTVTLAALDQVRSLRVQAEAEAQTLTNKASDLQGQAEQRFADAGAIIVPRESEANLAADLKPQVDRASELVGTIKSLDKTAEEIAQRPHPGLRGTLDRVRDRNQARKTQGERDRASSELRQLLIAIGRTAADSPIADAGKAASDAIDLQKAAAEATSAASVKSAEAAAYSAEINRREASEKEMGFDALYTAASLSKNGPPVITSPIELKRGEHALLAVPATLARSQTRTRLVGGSRGFSFPIGHTGIRYRVGSFHGQPVSQQVMTQVDRGTVVVTNQRIAFVGALKSVVVPLPKVVHLEVYNDGLAVFHEGRENADYIMCKAPKQVLFYVNWALNQELG